MNVYVSGALMGAKSLVVARARYEQAATVLARAGHCPYLPHETTDPDRNAAMTQRAVYERDLAALLASDVVLAFLDEPSLGVGAEVALALQHGIPVVAVAKPGDDVSRFLCGLLTTSPRARFVEYTHVDQLADFVARLPQ